VNKIGFKKDMAGPPNMADHANFSQRWKFNSGIAKFRGVANGYINEYSGAANG
jgi:hypothetical protein